MSKKGIKEFELLGFTLFWEGSSKMNKKKGEIQRKYREQMREKTEQHKEDGGSHTFEIVVVLAIIILIFFFNSVFKAF